MSSVLTMSGTQIRLIWVLTRDLRTDGLASITASSARIGGNPRHVSWPNRFGRQDVIRTGGYALAGVRSGLGIG